MQEEVYDYSPLNQVVTKEDVNSYKSTYAATINIGATLLLGVGGLVFGLGVVAMILSTPGSDVFITFALLSFIATIAILSSTLLFDADRKARKSRIRLFKFVALNKLQLTINKTNPGYKGMFFEYGDTKTILEAVVFNTNYEIGNFQSETISNRSKNRYYATYIRISLSRNLPHMVLDSKKTNTASGKGNVAMLFGKDQIVRLEGDFNEYFTLYAPQEYQQDARYIFTPDVMAAVIDKTSSYDIEIIDNSMVIFSSGREDLSKESKMRELVLIAEEVGREVHGQAHRYSDSRVGDKAENRVAQSGRRLSRRVSMLSIAVVVIIALAYIATSALPLLTNN